MATVDGDRWTVLNGDCFRHLADLPSASVDAIVTDPPYGIDFQGEQWDGVSIRDIARRRSDKPLSANAAFQLWCETWASECRRVLKPGAHLVAFGSPRTAHRLAAGIEDAKIDLRDTLLWLYGSGMPKSRRLPGGRSTVLKPAYEPIVLARRPLEERPIERNLRRHGTGALNTTACRVNERYPANVVLSHAPRCQSARCAPSCPATLIDQAANAARSKTPARRQISRLFYASKASRRERDAGCDRLPRRTLDLFPNAQTDKRPATAHNAHPTVKPIALMRWLIRLTCPDGGVVLDPFCGSGSTGAAAVLEQRRFIGIEREPAYAAIAEARIAHWAEQSDIKDPA